MKRLSMIACMALGLSGVFGAPAQAKVDVSASANFSNAYVWRGITFNDEGVFQPAVDISHESGLGVNVWGNLDMGDFNDTLDAGTFSELDLTLSYALPIPVEAVDELLDVSVGTIFYKFPQVTDLDTQELFLSAGVGVCEAVSLGANVYWDVNEIDSTYTSVGATVDLGALGLKLSEQCGLEFSATFGFAGDKFAAAYGGTDGGAFDVNLAVSASHQFTDHVGVQAFIAYTDSLDNDALVDQPVDVYGGGGVTLTF